MDLEIISFKDLTSPQNKLEIANKINRILSTQGIIGVKDIPDYVSLSRQYILAAREFCAQHEDVKKRFAPDRSTGETEGYELGAEQFQDEHGNWQVDDKKSSFYAFVPDDKRNKWPDNSNFKSAYLELGELIFTTGKLILKVIQLDESKGINHNQITGYGRMLHYHKEGSATNANPNWCGAHLDHGIFTGLLPAYYFREGQEVDEPTEAGLFIKPTNSADFIKIQATDKSLLLFQVGEFAQLASNDQICATKHFVKKTSSGVERFTFALFFSAGSETKIISHSRLTQDPRYQNNKDAEGGITYGKWDQASFERYHAK